jgi:mannonate dehydratase
MKTTIRDVKAITTAPAGINLVVVKIETSEPGLYGLGCATFTQRWMSVASAITDHLRPLLIGREADRIEELWQLMYQHSYWRNSPVLNNAIAGVDIALWDIKGKRAGMPLYDLLGGKVREGAAVYRHADAADPKAVEDRIHGFLGDGVRHVRVQVGSYGGSGKGNAYDLVTPSGKTYQGAAPEGAQPGSYFHPRAYMRATIAALEHVRGVFGDGVELIHDVHERLPPALAVDFAKELEPLRLFFLEDLLSPEHSAWFANVRQVCTTPLAMGELFNSPLEWTPLITGRLIDFMRMHITAMGGLTPARKAAIVGEAHGVRTAWHGPGDVSPAGHTVNVHLDLASHNFGIQEWSGFNDALREVFPGCPELRRGYAYVSDKPGHGVEINEALAAKFPCQPVTETWTQSRLPDGSLARP